MKLCKSLLIACLAAALTILLSQALCGGGILVIILPPHNPSSEIEIPANASIPLNASSKPPPEAFESPEEKALNYIRSNVRITVDGEEYHVGEVVEITFINEGNSTVELTDPPWAVFKLTKDGWVKVYEPALKLKTVLQYDRKRGEYVEVEAPETVKIEPYGKVSWRWNMTIHGKPIEPGYYAIALRDDLLIMVDGESMGLIRVGGLTRESLEDPIAYFTVK